MIRHLLAPVVPAAAGGLAVPRRLSHASGVALTFDDGPHPEGTAMMLEILSRAGARATFFVVGEQVERRPELVRRIVAEGHEVALHGFRHVLQPRMSARHVEQDIARGISIVEAAAQVRVRCHRPPYGIYSPAGLAIVRERGLAPLLWSRWGKDWRRLTTPARIASRATADLEPGDVILLHDADFYSAKDSHRRTAQALEKVLNHLKRRELATVLPV